MDTQKLKNLNPPFEEFGSPTIELLHTRWHQAIKLAYKFLVSKETVVLRRWESETGKFGFIKRVDKGRITIVNDLES